MQPGGVLHNGPGFPSSIPDRTRRGPRPETPASSGRTRIEGKFFFRGDEKLYLKGVTCGTFAPGPDGDYPTEGEIASDFAAMAASGINTVRTYTVPPEHLLDAAQREGLLVMVGLPWEQHVAFLDDRGRARSIERRVRDGVRATGGLTRGDTQERKNLGMTAADRKV